MTTTIDNVEDIAPRIQYIAGAGQTAFDFPFPIFEDSDVVVDINGATMGLSTNYTVFGAGNDTGGTVTLTVGATLGQVVTIYRDIPIERTTDFQQNGPFGSATFNTELDRITMIEQQLEAAIQRCLRIPTTANVADSDIELPPTTWASRYLTFDANGKPTPAALVTGTITQALLAGLLQPQTQREINAGVTPSNDLYVEGSLLRYGAVGDGATDDSSALQKAVNVGIVRVPTGYTFKIITPATKTGAVMVIGEGKGSKFKADGLVLSITNGTGSTVDNIWLENITTPYLIARNPANWTASLTPTLSNGLGYQPTTNDPEYATWVSGQPLVGTQNIGPVIQFQGAASDVTVSRIFGRFVRINMFDIVSSSVENCDFQGGKGIFAAVLFDNCSNNVQRGAHNRAVNNRISYASQCGITFISNDDFVIRGNHCYLCGQSGTQTSQTSGFTFNASVGGATSGTLTGVYTGPTFSDYGMGFENGEVRTVTLTHNSAAVSWTGVLPAGNLTQVAAWGHSTLFNNSTMDTRCIRGQIVANRTYWNYFDGLDCASTFGTTNGASRTYHLIADNYSFGNRGDGMNVDGQFGNVTGNTLYSNGNFGIWGVCQNTMITANTLLDNNQSRNSGLAEILAVGGPANKIADNYIWAGATQNCPAIEVTQTSVNYVTNNTCVGPIANNLGNTGLVASVNDGNIDSNSGAATRQGFVVELVNNAGTFQHIFYADASAAAVGRFDRINGATSGGFTNTPSGTDASTAMAAGLKIGSGTTNALWLDTAAQAPSGVDMSATIVQNSSGTVLNVSAMFQSININGVTRPRLTLQFTNASTGAAFTINTTNIASGKSVFVQFSGRLA